MAEVTIRAVGLVVVAGQERVLAEVAQVAVAGAVAVAAMRADAQRILALELVVPAAQAAVHRLEAPRTTTRECSLQ